MYCYLLWTTTDTWWCWYLLRVASTPTPTIRPTTVRESTHTPTSSFFSKSVRESQNTRSLPPLEQHKGELEGRHGGGRQGDREERRKGGREEGRKRGREAGRKGGRKEGRKGGREEMGLHDENTHTHTHTHTKHKKYSFPYNKLDTEIINATNIHDFKNKLDNNNRFGNRQDSTSITLLLHVTTR